MSGNYSMTSLFSKMLESIIRDKIVSYLEWNSLNKDWHNCLGVGKEAVPFFVVQDEVKVEYCYLNDVMGLRRQEYSCSVDGGWVATSNGIQLVRTSS